MAELLHTLEKDTQLEQNTSTSATEQTEQSKGTRLQRFIGKDIEQLAQILSQVATRAGAAEACATVITQHSRQLEGQPAAVIAILETLDTKSNLSFMSNLTQMSQILYIF